MTDAITDPIDGAGPALTRSDLGALARSSTLSLIGTIAKGVLGFAFILIVTRGLGPRGSGIVLSAVAFFTILSALKIGADTGLVRFVSRLRTIGRFGDLRTELSVAIYPVAIISMGVAAGVFAFAKPVADLLFEPADEAFAVSAIRLLAFFLPLSVISDVMAGATRGFGTVLPYVAVESFGKPLLRVVLAWFVLAAGMSSLAVVTAWSIPFAVGIPVMAIWLASLLRRSERSNEPLRSPGPRAPLAREFWRFCIPQGTAALLQTAVRSLDILLVGAMRGAAEAGVYAAVSRTVLYGQFAIDALRIAIAPQISSLLASGDHDRAESVYRVGTWWLIMVSWPPYVVLAVFAPTAMQIFGSGFSSGQHALVILSLGMLISIASGNVSTVLLMSGKSAAVLFDTAAALVVDVILNLLLIPRLGIEGAAIAWVASIATAESLALWQVWRHLRIDPFGAGFAVATLGSLACFGGLGLVVRFALGTSIPVVILSTLASVAAYSALVYRYRSVMHLHELWRVVASRHRAAQGAELGVVKGGDA